jgi:hypothetical protein
LAFHRKLFRVANSKLEMINHLYSKQNILCTKNQAHILLSDEIPIAPWIQTTNKMHANSYIKTDKDTFYLIILCLLQLFAHVIAVYYYNFIMSTFIGFDNIVI